MLKVWIAGASGQIGRALNDVLDPMEIEALNTDLDELDITDTDEVINFGTVNRPYVIINCTGITDTDECEKNPEHAYRVNALGARNLSIVARKCGSKIVQLSTDDVFDGQSKKPYTEFDDTNPLTVYGRSKRAGEYYVKEFTHKHFIIRSNWVYGQGGRNFVNRVLEAVESLIPFFAGIPGMKLGLANLAVLFILEKYTWKEAALVSAVRIVVIGFMFGNLFSILYSLAGAALSLTVMTLMKKKSGFSILGISVAGGVSHNIGQLIIASLITMTSGLIYYAPALLISGVITGLLIGTLTSEVLKRIRF